MCAQREWAESNLMSLLIRTLILSDQGPILWLHLILITSRGKKITLPCWLRQWHSTPVLLPRKSHGWRSLVGCSPWGLEESDTTERLHFHFSLSCIGEGNGNPLQWSCLENPRDRGAWWAAVYGVAQSRTRLKRLSSSSSSWLNGKKSASNAGNQGLIPGLGRSPREENGNLLQYSCLENPMDRGDWQATVHGVTKSWIWLRD